MALQLYVQQAYRRAMDPSSEYLKESLDGCRDRVDNKRVR